MGRPIKYPVNNNYFDEWSANMAYILGFIITDGCITTNNKGETFRLEFNIKDKEILEYIRDILSPTRPIFTKIRYRKGTSCTGHTLRISINQHLVDILNKYGICCRKTGKEVCPDYIPKEFFTDYFRGIFDGDGCIRIAKNHNIFSARFKITSASKIFLEQLNKHLNNKLNVYHRITENIYDLCSNNKINIKYLYNLMYNNNNFCLQRKKDIFQKAIML